MRRVAVLLAVLFTCGAVRAQSVKVLLPTEFASLDPTEVLNGDQGMVLYHVFCRLYSFDEHMNVVPDLVASEAVSADHLTWTLKLRAGAVFHDGTPADAEAVKYTVERMIAKKGSARVLYTPITKVAVIDAATVALTTDKPFPALRNNLAAANAGLIGPRADAALGARFGVQPVSCGPYAFKSWTRGSRIIVERNERYYGPKPPASQIVFQFVPDASTRLFLMLRHEADLAIRFGPAEAAQLEKAGVRVVRVNGRNIFEELNTTRAPTNDVRVRQAINYAVDKEAIIAKVLQGAGTMGHSVLEANTWASIQAGTYGYDPERARGLLREAGVEHPHLLIVSPDNRYLLDSQVSQAIAGYLRDVGFEVELKVIGDWAGYVDRLGKRDFSLFMLGWGSSTGDPDQVLQSLFASERAGTTWNFGAYSDKGVDGLIAQARSTFEDDRRRALYEEVQRKLFADAPWLFLYRVTSFMAVGDAVKTLHTLEGPEFPYLFDLVK